MFITLQTQLHVYCQKDSVCSKTACILKYTSFEVSRMCLEIKQHFILFWENMSDYNDNSLEACGTLQACPIVQVFSCRTSNITGTWSSNNSCACDSCPYCKQETIQRQSTPPATHWYSLLQLVSVCVCGCVRAQIDSVNANYRTETHPLAQLLHLEIPHMSLERRLVLLQIQTFHNPEKAASCERDCTFVRSNIIISCMQGLARYSLTQLAIRWQLLLLYQIGHLRLSVNLPSPSFAHFFAG